jgi:hypothetical protein
MSTGSHLGPEQDPNSTAMIVVRRHGQRLQRRDCQATITLRIRCQVLAIGLGYGESNPIGHGAFAGSRRGAAGGIAAPALTIRTRERHHSRYLDVGDALPGAH